MRKTKHRRRFHTDRIVQNRRARYVREAPDWLGHYRTENHDEWWAKMMSYGRLADRDPWDCGRRCWLCHYEKLLGYPRAREKRAWQRDWL